MDDRRCTARSSQTGEPCKRYAIAGGTVCPSHGGSAPAVKEAARRRLLEWVDPVAAELVRLALEAESESVRLAACRDLLDRVGVVDPKETEITTDQFMAKVAELEAELDAMDVEEGRRDG